MSFSGTRSKKTITNGTQHAHDEQSDKAISRRYATRSATKSENPTTNKIGDHCSSSPGELSQISKYVKSKTWNSKSKSCTSPSSPCVLSQASDCQCAGTSRSTSTKKSTVEASLPGSQGRVSKDQHKGQDGVPEIIVTPKKGIVYASSQKSSQLSLHHSKKTKDLKSKDQSSTIACSSSQTSPFLEDQHTTKDPKLGNKTTSSAKKPSQRSKDHCPKKTQNTGNLKSEISTTSSKPMVQHALGSKYSESKKNVINTRSPSKSIQPSKHQPAIKISRDSTPKYNENVILSLTKSNLVSKSELADQKGKTKRLEKTPKQLYNKESRVQYFVTWNGFEEPEPEPEPCGLNCYLCAKDLACSLDKDNINDKALLPEVAVLACGHVFHSICLSLRTSEEQYQYSREPKCVACLGFSRV